MDVRARKGARPARGQGAGTRARAHVFGFGGRVERIISSTPGQADRVSRAMTRVAGERLGTIVLGSSRGTIRLWVETPAGRTLHTVGGARKEKKRKHTVTIMTDR